MGKDTPCAKCKFWEKDQLEGRIGGWCRRYSPKPVKIDSSIVWPSTKPTDWCGEYKPKDSK